MPAARIAFASLALAVLAALWYAFRPQAVVATAPVAPPASQAAIPVNSAQQSQMADKKTFDLVLRAGKLVSGPAALKVRQGDQVGVSIDSDAPDELHVHGYDLK